MGLELHQYSYEKVNLEHGCGLRSIVLARIKSGEIFNGTSPLSRELWKLYWEGGGFFSFHKKRWKDVVLFFISMFLAVRFWSFELRMVNYVFDKIRCLLLA